MFPRLPSKCIDLFGLVAGTVEQSEIWWGPLSLEESMS